MSASRILHLRVLALLSEINSDHVIGRQGRQPIRATARFTLARSRWSLIFVKDFTIVYVSSIGTIAMDLLQQTSEDISLRDDRVAAAAHGCLQRCSYRAIQTVTCQYHQGTITLRGVLSSYFFKQVAQEAVAGIQGVDRVVNEIEVADA
jgi:osmotically-inducible protein OsmY